MTLDCQSYVASPFQSQGSKPVCAGIRCTADEKTSSRWAVFSFEQNHASRVCSMSCSLKAQLESIPSSSCIAGAPSSPDSGAILFWKQDEGAKIPAAVPSPFDSELPMWSFLCRARLNMGARTPQGNSSADNFLFEIEIFETKTRLWKPFWKIETRLSVPIFFDRGLGLGNHNREWDDPKCSSETGQRKAERTPAHARRCCSVCDEVLRTVRTNKTPKFVWFP